MAGRLGTNVQKQGFATGIAHPESVEQQPMSGAVSSEVEQKQGFATGIAHPEPVEQQPMSGAVTAGVEEKQASASGVAHPEPVEHANALTAQASEGDVSEMTSS
jgi:hypothetical protein